MKNARNLIQHQEIQSEILNSLIPFLTCILAFLQGSALLLATTNSLHAAEDTLRGSSASSMPHPELSPQGIHYNSFILSPGINYINFYDDNVFATSNFQQSSRASEFSPTIRVNSNWSKHALNLSASSTIGKNFSFASEDFNDWAIKTNGQLDIHNDIKLFSGIDLEHKHISRTAPNTVRGIEPTQFEQNRIFTRYTQKFGRVFSAININLINKDFHDVEAIREGNLVTIDNSRRNRSELSLSIKSGIKYVGEEQVFILLTGFQHEYDNIQASSGLDRSSTGIESSVGASFDYHGLLIGNFSLGYHTQQYSQPLPDINEPVISTTVLWNNSDLTTTTFILERSIHKSIDINFSGYISTSISLGLDHELKRNLILSLSAQRTVLEYTGIPPANREIKIYDLITSLTYKMNRNLFFTMQYQNSEREDYIDTTTSKSNLNYIKNLISFQLQAQY